MSTRMYDEASLGETLRAARRSRGVSIDEASATTRVSPRVIEAFENDDYDAMPPRGYAQNMLGAYANYLGLDRRKIADLYADGFEDAARGKGAHGSTSYRRGRPIDVSTASWVDPNAGRRRPEPPRPSISGKARESRGRQAGRPVAQGHRAPGSRRGGQAGEDDLHRLRHHSSLERPGIDDDRSPSAVTSYHHAGPSDPTRRMPRAGSGSASHRRPRSARHGGSGGQRKRDAAARRPSASREQGGHDAPPHHAGAARRGGAGRPRQYQPERQSRSQGFGHGWGLLREREEARERQERSLIAHARLLIPVFAAIILAIVAIALIATAGSRNSGDTMAVTAVSAASTAPSSASGQTQEQGASGSASYDLTVSSGHTCTATVMIDGSQAYKGTIVGPRTQSFAASRSVSFELSGTDGVTLAKNGTQVSLAANASGFATYEETLGDGS